MSDDGFRPDETSTGSEKLSSNDFWSLVNQQREEQVKDDPNGSLENRLLIAQSHGLAPNLRRQLAFVGAGEPVFELQVLGVRRYPSDSFDRSRAAHARGPEEAVRLCIEADGLLAHGTYLMPARLRPGVESRHAVPGRWFDIPKGGGTTDSDIEARLILAVDFDVKRPSAISATEEEMQRSVRVALNAWNFLGHHLGENSLAYLHSGNGRQIHISLDAIPVTDESKNTIAGLLTGLAHLFNTPEVMVDEKLFDAKRILPACGTIKKKGAQNVDDRPHRRTAIVTPEMSTRVSLEKLIELARTIWEIADAEGRVAIEKSFGIKPQTTTNVTAIRSNPGSPFDLAKTVDPQAVAEWLGLHNSRGEVVCPGCGETSGVSVINKGLKCHHNRCKDRGLRGFRNNVELVAEVHGVSAKEAVVEIGERFGLNIHFRNQDPTIAPTGAPASTASEPDTQQQSAPLPDQAPQPATGPFAYPTRFEKLTTTQIFEPLPPIHWLVKDLHLVAGRPTLIAGYGFSGKTLIMQSALIAVASATPVWGKFTPASAATVWHLDYEQGSYATKRRYQRLARGHGIPRDALGERLQVTIFPEVYLDSPDAVDVYSRAIDGVSVVALDALRGATPTMDENDSAIRRCLDNLSRISEKTGTAFIVLHHAGKSRDGDTGDPRKIPRGSSAIFDACGCVLAIEGEKNEPKLVCQTKAPAEAEGSALSDFYVSIEDVAAADGPTAGLRVVHQDARDTEVRVADAKLTERKEKVLSLVAGLPGQLTSANSIFTRLGGKKDSVMTAIRELFDSGQISQPGGNGTPIVMAREPVPVGSRTGMELVPGSPPLKGGTGTRVRENGHGGEPIGGQQEPDKRTLERAATAESDSAELCDIDTREWRALATERGWSATRYSGARALANSRLERTRADGASLHQVGLQGKDARAWATERGWDDLRIRGAIKFAEKSKKPEPPADDSTPTRTEPFSAEAEEDADALMCMTRKEMEARVRDWPEQRRLGATEALRLREPAIIRDAKRLRGERSLGTDIDAWAAAKGWSDARLRAAKMKMD
jgi:hypothetical protein